jgi:hypothetical protein
MNWWKSNAQQSTAGTERRRDPRIGGHFKVRYSGSDGNKIVMGYGTITDLSRYGFGIAGGRGVKRGMELALFLNLPDGDGPMCIPQAIVSWINGGRFGVELRSARSKEIDWLERVSERS